MTHLPLPFFTGLNFKWWSKAETMELEGNRWKWEIRRRMYTVAKQFPTIHTVAFSSPSPILPTVSRVRSLPGSLPWVMKHWAWKLVHWWARGLLRNSQNEDIRKYTKLRDRHISFFPLCWVLMDFLCYGRQCSVTHIFSPIALPPTRLPEQKEHFHVFPASCQPHGFPSSSCLLSTFR